MNFELNYYDTDVKQLKCEAKHENLKFCSDEHVPDAVVNLHQNRPKIQTTRAVCAKIRMCYSLLNYNRLFFRYRIT